LIEQRYSALGCGMRVALSWSMKAILVSVSIAALVAAPLASAEAQSAERPHRHHVEWIEADPTIPGTIVGVGTGVAITAGGLYAANSLLGTIAYVGAFMTTGTMIVTGGAALVAIAGAAYGIYLAYDSLDRYFFDAPAGSNVSRRASTNSPASGAGASRSNAGNSTGAGIRR
jgi:hypothetical protein